MNPTTVDILETITTLRDELQNLGALAAARVRAEHDYERQKTAAYLNAEGPVETRKAIADAASHAKRLTYLESEGAEKTARTRVSSYQSILSALQTIQTGEREEAKLVRVSGGDV